MKGSLPPDSISKTVILLGWFKEEEALASWMNRTNRFGVQVARFVQRAHAAFTELLQNFKVNKFCAWRDQESSKL